MLSREDNERLTRTGPGTPMGTLMRSYWLPAFLSTELEAGGEPKAVKLLGERLVGFRDPEGTVGILDEFCPHRRASLAYARNEPEGLRCIYHGWQVSRCGRIVDTPAESVESTFKDRILHPSYPCHEVAGTVWTYLGPAPAPVFPRWEWMSAPASRLDITKVLEDCNWLQGVEGSIDSAHSDYLHSTEIRGRPSDHAPRLEVEDTAYGFRCAAIRTPDGDGKERYVRVTLYAVPFHCLIPPQRGGGNEVAVHQVWVPVDDEHNYFYSFRHYRMGTVTTPHRAQFELDFAFSPKRNRHNKHLQDRKLMQAGHWSGITAGVNSQDLAVIESGEPITDRTREHLGASDIGVAHLRHTLLRTLRRLQSGENPPGIAPPIAYDRLRSVEIVVPADTPWQSVAATAEP